jgi:hypothetical protein
MGAVIRFFAAVHGGRIVGAVSSIRPYRYAVLHFVERDKPPVVIWRTSFEGAYRVLSLNRRIRTREMVSAIETSTLLTVGSVVEQEVLDRLNENPQPQTTNPGGST